jgi:putative membrane protein
VLVTADNASPDGERFTVRPTSDSHFSWLRTRLALDRTLMAWVRTSVSLIGFGFTIVQFFERFAAMEGIAAAQRPQAPRYLGLALIGCGVVVLLISVWQYRAVIRYLRSGSFAELAGIEGGPTYTPLYAVSVALIFIGLFAFVAVLTRAL